MNACEFDPLGGPGGAYSTFGYASSTVGHTNNVIAGDLTLTSQTNELLAITPDADGLFEFTLPTRPEF